MAIISPQRREHINRWGIWHSLYEFLMIRLQRHCGLVFCAVITRPLRTSVPPLAENSGSEYRFLSEQELIKFAKNSELQIKPSVIKAAFAKGDTCTGAINNGRLIAYLWRAYSPTKYTDGLWIDFGPQARYSYDSFTLPQHRGQRVLTTLSLSTDALDQRGRKNSIAFIETHNYSSLKNAEFSGNTIVGYAGYWHFFGKYYTFHSIGAKKEGFRFFAAESTTSA
jgi:hypothetical protein